MSDYVSTIDFDQTADLLRQTPGPIVVVTHSKPDGDAFGSVIALSAAFRLLERQVTPIFVPPIPEQLLQLGGANLAEVYREGMAPPEASFYVVLDTGAWVQLGPLRPFIEPHLDRTLIIDHHLSGDMDAKYRFIDGRAAACAEIIGFLLEKMLPAQAGEFKLPQVIRDALFVGIASDTGWFRFSNTRPRTHEMAAKLVRQGADHSDLYRRLEQSERPEKLALTIRALGSLKLLAGGRAAVMTLRREDFEQTGALEEETERIIDIPQQVGTIQVIVLVSERVEQSNNGQVTTTRLSFRSKPGPDAINVAELAERFGGGGHARAAGAKIDKPIDEVVRQIIQALEEVSADNNAFTSN